MNDALYEQLIARRPKPYDLPVRILVILVIVAVAVLGTPFLGVLSFVTRGRPRCSRVLLYLPETQRGI